MLDLVLWLSFDGELYGTDRLLQAQIFCVRVHRAKILLTTTNRSPRTCDTGKTNVA